MEHKLIQGGEQYLPFARSRIKALRATGLSYASQQFEVDGVSVKVRIAGEHEYISLGGGVEMVLSGVIKGGTVSILPPVAPDWIEKNILSSYKPTDNAWNYPLKKDPAKPTTSFNDEKFLANAETQYADLVPSMFSGLMAKTVQVLMGMGIKVLYDYKYLSCHGVVRDSDNKPWLIWIDQTKGVVAMPMPLVKGSGKSKTSKVDAAKQIAILLGGLPSGVSFPTDIDAAITAGTVIRLATVSSLGDYFTKLRYSDYMGWSFNDTGSEAHNTCYTDAGVGSVVTSYHYKLSISITAKTSTTPASGTAMLSLVSSGVLKRTTAELPRIGFTDTSPTIRTLAAQVDNTALTADTSVTVLVCHINGALETVQHFRQFARLPIDITTTQTTGTQLIPAGTQLYRESMTLYAGNYVTSTSFPGPFHIGYSKQTTSISEADREEMWSGPSGILRIQPRTVNTSESYSLGQTSMVWSYGCRDGYFMYDGAGSIFGLTTTTIIPDVVAPSYPGIREWPTQKYFLTRYVDATHIEIYESDQSAEPDYALWATHSLVTPGVYLVAAANAMMSQSSPVKTWGAGSTTVVGPAGINKRTVYFVQPRGAPQALDLETPEAAGTQEAFWSSVGGKQKLTARASVFGPATALSTNNHVFFTSVFDYMAATEPQATGYGSLFDGEAMPSSTKYNFIGYV